MGKKNEIKPLDEEKTTVNGVEIIFQKFQDISNIYFCSECSTFIRPDVEAGEFFWYSPMTGGVLCGSGDCKEKHMEKIIEKAKEAEEIDLTKEDDEASEDDDK